MDHAVRIDSAPNDGQQRLSGTIWHDLRIDAAAPLKDSKDRGFAIGASAPFAFDAPGAEVRFVDLYLSLNRRGLLTELDPFPDQPHIAVDGVSVQTHQRRNFTSVQIEVKVPHKLPEFGYRNS